MLRFGVRKDERRFHAHSWVDYQDAVLNDHPTVGQDYTPLRRFPTAIPEGHEL